MAGRQGMPGHGRTWPDEACDQLRELAADGRSAREIGELMGRTRNAVIGAAYRLGVRLGGSAGRLQSEGARMLRARRLERKPPKAVPPRKPRIRDLLAALPPTEATETTTETPAKLVSFEALEPHHCRYIHGDVHTGPWGYCASHKVAGLSYCKEHAQRCYRVPDPVAKTTFVPGRKRVFEGV